MNLLTAIILVLIPFGTQDNAGPGHGLLIKDTSVMMVVDENTTLEELADYKLILSEQLNISINYKVVLDEDLKIRKIKLEVDCNDGYKGSYKAKFKYPNQKAGFYRIWDTRYEVPFAVCNLPRIGELEK